MGRGQCPPPAPPAKTAAELAVDRRLEERLQHIAATARKGDAGTDQAVDAWLREAITAAKQFGYVSLRLPFRNGSPLAGLFAGRLVHHVGKEVDPSGQKPYRFWLDWGNEDGFFPDLLKKETKVTGSIPTTKALTEAERKARKANRVKADQEMRRQMRGKASSPPPKGRRS